jgi:hypothetical protein
MYILLYYLGLGVPNCDNTDGSSMACLINIIKAIIILIKVEK